MLFPVFCVSCQREGEWWCAECRSSFPGFRSLQCPMCPEITTKGEVCDNCKAVSPLSGVTALFNYEENTAPTLLIKELKYSGARSSASVWGKIFMDYFHTHPLPFGDFFREAVAIVPVPLHPKRQRERGFNQSEIIAEALVKVLEGGGERLQFRPKIVSRIRNTRQQATLSGVGRKNNIQGAFQLSDTPLPRAVVLVDDVYTTGSTMGECARALKAQGVEKVWGVVLARG